jgi:hypothetical protein
MIDSKRLTERLAMSGRTILSGVLEGLDAMAAAEAARLLKGKPLVHVALDDQRMASLAEALAFFAPDVEVISFPALRRWRRLRLPPRRRASCSRASMRYCSACRKAA